MRPSTLRRAMRPGPRAARGASLARTLSVFEQGARLGFVWPQLRCEVRGRGKAARLVCRGKVRPSPVTGIYTVRLEYAVGEPPVAVVEAPSLVSRSDGAAIPHMYPADDRRPARPCLHYPADGDWTGSKALATTIVPWLLEWLLHYEVWFTTGEWRGGGVEHPPSPSDRGDRPADTVAPRADASTCTSMLD